MSSNVQACFDMINLGKAKTENNTQVFQSTEFNLCGHGAGTPSLKYQATSSSRGSTAFSGTFFAHPRFTLSKKQRLNAKFSPENCFIKCESPITLCLLSFCTFKLLLYITYINIYSITHIPR